VNARARRLARDLLVVDVGNSKVLAVLFGGGVERFRVRLDYAAASRGRWAASWRAALRALRALSGASVPVLLASVAPRRADPVERGLRRHFGGRIHRAGWRDPWPFRIGVRAPATLGADRLANTAGLMALGHASGVAIDAGTAITFDVLDRGRLRGGLILPGFALVADALHDHTAQLPRVQPLPTPDLVGTDTGSALRAGIHHGVTGGVVAIAAAVQRTLGRGAPVVFTGGDGERLCAECPLPGARFEPDLLLAGMRLVGQRIFPASGPAKLSR
jgi:type III pantothenate kinase